MARTMEFRISDGSYEFKSPQLHVIVAWDLLIKLHILKFYDFIFNFQRALESHQLKTAVERTTMNDIHMQTIKVCFKLLHLSMYSNM